MWNIPLTDIFAKMPIEELDQSLNEFISPMTELLPEERLRRVVPLAVRGILAQETPVIAAMAQSVSRQKMDCWAAAKRIYRFVENKRIHHHQLLKGMYKIARRTVAQEQPNYVVVALDPVNFEKPYTKKLEGVSTVHKSTPPNLEGEARLAHGYPAMTATVVNTAVPAISYANWFSYQTDDFLSQNREIQRSIRTTRWVFPGQKRRSTWNGWWKSTTLDWIAGKPSICRTWSIVFSGRLPTRRPSSTPDAPVWPISKWVGSRSACRKPIKSCGLWWSKATLRTAF